MVRVTSPLNDDFPKVEFLFDAELYPDATQDTIEKITEVFNKLKASYKGRVEVLLSIHGWNQFSDEQVKQVMFDLFDVFPCTGLSLYDLSSKENEKFDSLTREVITKASGNCTELFLEGHFCHDGMNAVQLFLETNGGVDSLRLALVELTDKACDILKKAAKVKILKTTHLWYVYDNHGIINVRGKVTHSGLERLILDGFFKQKPTMKTIADLVTSKDWVLYALSVDETNNDSGLYRTRFLEVVKENMSLNCLQWTGSGRESDCANFARTLSKCSKIDTVILYYNHLSERTLVGFLAAILENASTLQSSLQLIELSGIRADLISKEESRLFLKISLSYPRLISVQGAKLSPLVQYHLQMKNWRQKLSPESSLSTWVDAIYDVEENWNKYKNNDEGAAEVIATIRYEMLQFAIPYLVPYCGLKKSEHHQADGGNRVDRKERFLRTIKTRFVPILCGSGLLLVLIVYIVIGALIVARQNTIPLAGYKLSKQSNSGDILQG